jgi:hypothetical protein
LALVQGSITVQFPSAYSANFPADVIAHDEQDVGSLCLLLVVAGEASAPRLVWMSLPQISAAVAANSDKPLRIVLRFIV